MKHSNFFRSEVVCGWVWVGLWWGAGLIGVRLQAASDVPEAMRAGQAVYDQHCAACHGAIGDGNGPATVWLYPKPRRFTEGLFKLQSTPAGALPTDEDLLASITRGLPGSSMPSFTYLSVSERRQVVSYVKFLTVFTNSAGERLNRFEEQARNPPKPISVPPEPPVTFERLTQGKELFSKLQCSTCHGETGAGDGPNAGILKDSAGIPLVPRDFNTGAFRGGSRGQDIYLRIATGLAGTPMLPFGDEVMTPDQRWSLVYYIQSLRRKEAEVNDILTPEDSRIAVKKVTRLPADPLDSAWEALDAVRVPLNPLWPSRNPVSAVAVRVATDGRRIGFLLQWRDGIVNGAPVRVQDFQDAAAMQFSLTGRTPFLGMGDPENPVNLWQWKAGWQEGLDGVRPDVNTVYGSMHTDLYPEKGALFRTAEAAGNLLSQAAPSSTVEEANARGFGSLQSQPATEQDVQGKAVWRDGSWSVMMTRRWRARGEKDVKFGGTQPVPVAFAIWDGADRDRAAKKVVSNWYHLTFEK